MALNRHLETANNVISALYSVKVKCEEARIPVLISSSKPLSSPVSLVRTLDQIFRYNNFLFTKHVEALDIVYALGNRPLDDTKLYCLMTEVHTVIYFQNSFKIGLVV